MSLNVEVLETAWIISPGAEAFRLTTGGWRYFAGLPSAIGRQSAILSSRRLGSSQLPKDWLDN